MVTRNKLKEEQVRFCFAAGVLAIAIVFMLGCSAAKYRKAADKEVYQILSERHEHVFGEPHDFSIDTEYSMRKPADVNGSELILDRARGSQARLITLPEALEIAAQAASRDDLICVTGSFYLVGETKSHLSQLASKK